MLRFAIALDLVLALTLAAVRAASGAAFGWLALPGAVGLAVVLASPAVVAVAAPHDRTALLAAGVISLLAAMSAFSLVTLPLLVPASLFLALAARSRESEARGAWSIRGLLRTGLLVGLAATAFLALFLGADPVCAGLTGGGSSCTSDSVTLGEAALAIGLVGLAGLVARMGRSAATAPRSRAAVG
ncbi:MAG TPA: hypothetical protein VFK38_00495 [Candidatus Limnocylindrales bacterium]|nr:hypothetical protein [Candidatus Limnocylindrales bacterium]